MIEVRVKPSKCHTLGAFFAWGKAGEILTDCPVEEPGDVWFDWADSHDEAYAKVYKEIEESLEEGQVHERRETRR
ncbi:MAG: hypothetical protein AAFR02_10280 [Pseudomonadota bacterium]